MKIWGKRAPADLFVTCPPQVLEFCHSAQTPKEHVRPGADLSRVPLDHAPEESLVLDTQSALWNSVLVRAASSFDILIAGYAIVNDATVLAADHDFHHIATVTDLSHEYIAPSS